MLTNIYPADTEEVSDLLNFFIIKEEIANITKRITNIYLDVENMEDLTSDHTPVLLIIGSTLIFLLFFQEVENNNS